MISTTCSACSAVNIPPYSAAKPVKGPFNLWSVYSCIRPKKLDKAFPNACMAGAKDLGGSYACVRAQPILSCADAIFARGYQFAHLGISDRRKRFRASTIATLSAGRKLPPGAWALSDCAHKTQIARTRCRFQGAQCDCAAHLGERLPVTSVETAPVSVR